MSLLIAFHDSNRAVVCSDDRAISFNAAGEPEESLERACKFILIGALIFVAVGRSDVCRALNAGMRRMLAADSFSVVELARILPEMLRRQWAARKVDPHGPLIYDALETAIIGHDGGRIRSFVFTPALTSFHINTSAFDTMTSGTIIARIFDANIVVTE
jgi:hypothetical protein